MAATLPITPTQAAKLLVAVQATDAVACAVPLDAIREELTRLGCPPWLQRTIPVLKAASAVGLLAGRRDERIGRWTSDALVAYFLCALAAHGRVRDPAWRWAAAAGMLGIVLFARRAFVSRDGDAPVPDEEVIDLAAPAAEPMSTVELVEHSPTSSSAARR